MNEKTRENPKNLDEMTIGLIDDGAIEVFDWGPGRDGEGPSTQVHLVLTLRDDLKIAVRLKSRPAYERLAAALAAHADRVWPKDGAPALDPASLDDELNATIREAAVLLRRDDALGLAHGLLTPARALAMGAHAGVGFGAHGALDQEAAARLAASLLDMLLDASPIADAELAEERAQRRT